MNKINADHIIKITAKSGWVKQAIRRSKPIIFMFSLCCLAAGIFILSAPTVLAFPAVEISTEGLPNGSHPDSPIRPNSDPMAILRLRIGTDATTTLASTTINFNFSDSPFSTTTLADLASATSSGVSLYNDQGNNVGYFDTDDQAMAMGQTPAWVDLGSSTFRIILENFTNSIDLSPAGTSTFFIVIKTSSIATSGAKITAIVPQNGIITSIGPAGPANDWSANNYIIDAEGPQVAAVELMNNTTVEVIFSEDIQGSANNSSYYSFNSGLSVINADMMGMNSVKVVADGNIEVGTTTLTITNDILDLAGNHAIAGTTTVQTAVRVKISEISPETGTSTSEFIELYNASGLSMNISDWKIQYSAADNGSIWTNLASVPASTSINPYGFYLVSTSQFDSTSAVDGDINMTSGLLALSGGHIRIFDYLNSKEIDRIGWGNAVNPEGEAAPAPAAGQSLERKAFGGSWAADMAPGGVDETMGNGWDTDNNSYDFVVQATTSPQNASSSAEQPEAGGWGGPMIDHAYINFAPTSTALHVFAQMGDPMTPLDELTTELHYMVSDGNQNDNTPGDYTTVYGTHQGNGFFQFTIPQAAIAAAATSATGVMNYYLKMITNNTTVYMSGSPEADGTGDENEVAKHPFGTACGPEGDTYNITGSVELSGTSTNAGVLVFLEGTGYSTTTDISGNYSLNAQTGTYNLIMIKEGYYEEWINDIYLNANKQMGTTTMSEGQGGGISGDNSNPIVEWTGPPDGESGIPAEDGNFSILVGFSKDINPSTFSTSTVVLTTDGANPIDGYQVAYNPTRESWMPTTSQAPYLGVIYAPAGGLATSTTYYLVMNGNIRDTAGNALLGNRSTGGHEISFTTSGDMDWDDFGSGGMMPPFVMDVKPSDGSLDVAPNTKISIIFSDTMNADSVTAANNVKLYKITFINDTEQHSAVGITTTLDTSGKIAIVTPNSSLSAGKYLLAVTGALQSSAGIWMGDPAQNQNINTYNFYKSRFAVGDATPPDATAPTILGSWPADGDTDIAVNPGALHIQFSENLDPSTVNANTVTLKRGSSLINSAVEYDAQAQSVYLMPRVVLATDVIYTLTLTGSSTGIKDMADNPLATDVIISFTTASSADTQAPSIMYANGDDYGLAVTFTEPMTAVKITDTNNWSYSVLNPDNYIVKWGDAGEVATSGAAINLSSVGAKLSYDYFTNTVMIEHLGLDSNQTNGKNFYLDMHAGAATDLSGNLIASGSQTTFQTPIMNSAETHGMLGPGNMMGPDMGDMGMKGAGAFPMNAMAGQSTVYFVNVPTSRAIPAGGKIVLTFPTGFDVSNAMADPNSPVNNDINEWNDGVITINSVSGDANTQAVTIVTAGASTQTNDFLHLDIKGIINSSIPRGLETSGYSIDMKTFDAGGNLLETINTMPIFITEAGQNSLTVVANLSGGTVDGANDEISVFLGSPMTGPMEGTIALTAASQGTTTFNGLPAGDYMIFTKPVYSLDGDDYAGMPMPEPISLTASTTKYLTFTKEGSGAVATVTVDIIGSFGTDDIDVFAGSPDGFKVKTITNAGTNPAPVNLYLPDGTWRVGMGPAMANSGPMSGPPPMPDWMPPMPVEVVVANSGATIAESSGTADDGVIEFTVATASMHIIGYVQDDNGNAIADAETWAYQPMGGSMGAHAKTDTNGKFTLKVAANGNYKIGVAKPGLPFVPEKSVVVKEDTDSGSSDGNATADVYRNGTTLNTAASPFVIKIKKPAYTISGRVTDGTNPVSYTPVWADQVNGYGHTDTMTDASGNYILYVENGTWRLNAYIPDYGNAETQTIAVSGSDVTQNLAPQYNTNELITLSGTVTAGGQALSYLPIRAVQFNNNGVYTGQEYGGQTDSNGDYAIAAPISNNYRIDIWTPEYGEVGLDTDEVANNPANVIATSTNRSGLDITINTANLRAISFIFYNASANQEGFLNIDGADFSSGTTTPKPTGFHLSQRISDLSATTTVQLADGDYFFFLDVPGLSNYIPDASDRDSDKNDIVISTTTTIHFTLPASGSETAVVSGTVTDGSNPIANAWVWLGNPSTGYRNGAQTATSGAYSLTAPIGNGYHLGADKPGYMSAKPVDLNITTTTTQNFTLTAGSYVISGHIYADQSGGTSNSYDAGEEIANGFVRAETVECDDSDTGNDSDCQRSHAPVDGSGAYELPVINGTWQIYGMADGYNETEYGANVSVSGANQTINIELTPNSDWVSAGKMKAITPASGGTLDDTTASGTGVKLTIPPNALGSSQSAGNINAQKTSAVTKTNSSAPIGNEGINVAAADNSGQAITMLNDYVDLEIVLYKDTVDAGLASGELSYSLLKNTNNSYWDSTANDWVNLTTTKSAYYKNNAGDTEWTLYANAATTTDAFEAFINELATGTKNPADYKLVYTSQTNHLTIFAIIMPFIVVPAQASPPPPSTSSYNPGGNPAATTYCDSVEYGEWQECIGGWQYRDITAQSPVGCALTAEQENSRKKECGVEETEKKKTPETTQVSTDKLYWDEAEMVFRAEVDEIIPAIGIKTRNHNGELLSRGTLTVKLKINLGALEPRQQYALTNFITYGSPSTAKLGWGERAGVINSFRAAFSKIPKTAADWQDIIKIAQGRWPGQRSAAAEDAAMATFKKIYLRKPNRSNRHDDAAITVMAYGLRPTHRNLNSERAAIRIFKAIFKYNPTSATDWDAVRAIAYSGATR